MKAAYFNYSTILCILLAGCSARMHRQPWSASESTFHRAAVAADHPVASQAGLEILRKGGNAVDAAVAISFTLSVVRPESCGLGGGGFMVIHAPTADGISPIQKAIIYREQCPATVEPLHYVQLEDNQASRFGYHASGVPGTVAGLLHVLDTYGTLDRSTVMAPAIRAAERGFAADQRYIKGRSHAREEMPGRNLGPLWNDGSENIPSVGQIVHNRDQARALRLIERDGADAFYRGEIGQAIVSLMQNKGGTLSNADLVSYRVRSVAPVRGKFQGHEILAMPPPSSGGVALLQMFGMLELRYKEIQSQPPLSPNYVHMVAEMMKHAFADRSEWLADSEFVDVPIDMLLDRAYVESRGRLISEKSTHAPDHYGSRHVIPEDGGTSHFSVIDADGMAVACTETINLEYGSLTVVPGYGFCLNNQMDDFTTQPGEANAFGLTQSTRNSPQPGKRPLSSMSPTIVLKNGRPIIIAGASGGPRIITSTFQCILNCLLHDMNAGQSVASPRFHHQWMPNRLYLEDGTGAGLSRPLKRFGHETEQTNSVGNVQLIFVDDRGIIHAASDPRKGGVPAGY